MQAPSGATNHIIGNPNISIDKTSVLELYVKRRISITATYQTVLP
jgi:hypothetical protein